MLPVVCCGLVLVIKGKSRNTNSGTQLTARDPSRQQHGGRGWSVSRQPPGSTQPSGPRWAASRPIALNIAFRRMASSNGPQHRHSASRTPPLAGAGTQSRLQSGGDRPDRIWRGTEIGEWWPMLRRALSQQRLVSRSPCSWPRPHEARTARDRAERIAASTAPPGPLRARTTGRSSESSCCRAQHLPAEALTCAAHHGAARPERAPTSQASPVDGRAAGKQE